MIFWRFFACLVLLLFALREVTLNRYEVIRHGEDKIRLYDRLEHKLCDEGDLTSTKKQLWLCFNTDFHTGFDEYGKAKAQDHQSIEINKFLDEDDKKSK